MDRTLFSSVADQLAVTWYDAEERSFPTDYRLLSLLVKPFRLACTAPIPLKQQEKAIRLAHLSTVHDIGCLIQSTCACWSMSQYCSLCNVFPVK